MADAMANINALIAQGPKPIQLDDPLGQMAKMYQIKSAQQTLTANEQKLAEANALKEYMKGRPDLTSPSTFSTMASQFGEAGANLASKLQKMQGDQIVAAKNATELMKSSATSVMANPTLTNAINAVRSFGQRTGTNVTSEIERLMSIGDNPDEIKRWAAGHAVSADKLLPVFESRDLGGTREEYQRDPVSGKPIGAPTVFQKTPTPTTSPLAKVIAEYNALPPGHPDRSKYENFFNLQQAGAIAQDSVTGNWINKATGQIVTPPSATPAGQPGVAPLVPGIAPAGQPVVTPTARPPLDMMQSPAFQELVRRGVVSTPQEAAALAQAMSLDAAGKPVNITVPNALAGAAPSVNAMAGAPAPANPVQARIAFQQQEQALNEPVQVIDPATGKTIYVSKKEAISRNMTPADKSFDLTPKQIQTLEAKFPQATSAVKAFESNAERLKKDLIELANHKGLSGISGLIYGRTPAVTADARKAEALYNSIVARGGFKELQDMRAASPTGGALGNVSNQENQYLRDAFAPIALTQSTPDLKKALLNAARATDESKQRIRETYDTTYEYRKNRSEKASGTWEVVR